MLKGERINLKKYLKFFSDKEEHQKKFRISCESYLGLDPWTKEVKDTNPLMSSSLAILFGAVKQFSSRFRIWTETECKTPPEYGLQYISTPPHSHTLSAYTVHWEGGGGGGQREGTVEGQQYTSIVPMSMVATFHKLQLG
jgi:hypothetical protein